MSPSVRRVDVIVIGAGHAGCEAALAAARGGCTVLVITPNLDRIGYMPCNPSIGGPGKSHIVAEVDALGGAMARVADLSAMQVRLLNRSKGPAVHAVRTQCDKTLYALLMKEALETQTGVMILQDTATGLLIDDDSTTGPPRVAGITAGTLGEIRADAVVVTAGTFLRARMVSGERSEAGGRAGEGADTSLASSLSALGVNVRRFKTGTPPRLDARSIDIDHTETQHGDDEPLWLSGAGERGELEPVQLPPPPSGPFARPAVVGGRWQVPCFQTHTTAAAHDLIRANLHRAPMFNGNIEGTGPRYCPSIEDKIGRFAGKDEHPVFIEPEGWRSHEVYVQGLSTSLPAEVQEAILPLIPGLARARITRYGYAVEYDAVDPTALRSTLECAHIGGLFFAGQINGTSGYEEAAGQGIVAGTNAAAISHGRDLLSLRRDESYIGVMIDDLVSMPFTEPYRMLTSRAEYRLLLRADTAADRMAPHAEAHGLLDADTLRSVRAEADALADILTRLERVWLGDNARHAAALEAEGVAPARRSMMAMDIARRPGTDLGALIRTLVVLGLWDAPMPGARTLRRAGVAAFYSAFIDKERRTADRQDAAASTRIPPGVDWVSVGGLRVEAAQRLAERPPETIDQARRTPGVTPSDIGAVLVHLRRIARTAPDRVTTP